LLSYGVQNYPLEECWREYRAQRFSAWC
jgi:hypothetical protein